MSESSPSILASGFGGCLLAVNGGRLEGSGLRVERCFASDVGGGIMALGTNSVVSLTHSFVIGNTAHVMGGGVAAVGQGARVSLADSFVENNDARTGSGGGVAFSEDVFFVLDTVIVSRNTAGGSGGALWAHPTSTGTVTNSTLSSNKAGVGGGVSVASEEGAEQVATADSAAVVPDGRDSTGGVSLPATLSLIDVGIVENIATKWGGGVYGCDGALAVSGGQGTGMVIEGNVALRSGEAGSSNDVFVCRPSGSEFVTDMSAAGAMGVPWLSVSPTLWTEQGLQWAVHGPLDSLDWVMAPSGSVEAGGVIHASVKGKDMFGQDVVYSGVALETTVDTAEVLAPISFPLAVLSSRVVSLPLAPLGVADVDAVPASVILRVRTGGDVVPLSASVGIEPCGVGRGAVLENGVTTCVPCSDGSISNVVSFDSCVTPEAPPACPPNSLRLVANTTEYPCTCTPGFWVESGMVDEPCAPCPRGGVCLGGLERPVAGPGFFPTEGGSTLFVACPNSNACAGGQCVSSGVPGEALCPV